MENAVTKKNTTESSEQEKEIKELETIDVVEDASTTCGDYNL